MQTETEHVAYTGPLRWRVCAACQEPWPCRIAEAAQAGADTAERAKTTALAIVAVQNPHRRGA